jgi:hypothetical protein
VSGDGGGVGGGEASGETQDGVAQSGTDRPSPVATRSARQTSLKLALESAAPPLNPMAESK